MSAPVTPTARDRRMRAPLLVLLWWLLGFEAAGGLLMFFMRLAAGTTPGELLHIAVGALLTLVYAVYQIQHWLRVTPFRTRMDYALGLIAAVSMVVTLGTGIALALPWWTLRMTQHSTAPVPYSTVVSAAHNIMSMLVLTFVGAHLAAVLLRDQAAKRR
ncbi:MAG: hypothetical protein ABL977_15430 [Candidatus Eisenbacteria bacterium]